MTLVRTTATFIFGAALAGQTLAAPEAPAPYHCEFTAITPADADFFTSGFRPHPVVGTRVDIDFEADQITSMTFADGQTFFGPGDGVLSRTGRISYGFGGVRVGNQGIYIVLLDEPYPGDDTGTFLVSRLAVTKADQDATGHLVTSETHSGRLECRP